MSEENVKDALWVEKYRPRELDDVVLEDQQKKFIGQCIANEDIPHLLFCGPPGSGKTTLARIITDKIIHDEGDILELNGSATTSVDAVRSIIEPYLKSPSFASKIKVVSIDEFDFMSSNAMGALRHIMEKYHEVGRFLCTANYESKIMPALHSRFQTYTMKTISVEFATKYCQTILDTEKVEYDVNNVSLVVKSLIPDVRKIVNTLQRNVVAGKLQGIDQNEITSIENKMIGHILQICQSLAGPSAKNVINTKMTDIMTTFETKGEPDYNAVYLKLFNSKIPPWAKILVNKYSNAHATCAIPQCHFIAMIWEIIQVGVEYYKKFKKK